MSLLRSNELRVLLKTSEGLKDLSGSVRSFSNSGEVINWQKDEHAIFIGFRHRFNHRYFLTELAGAAVETPAVGDPEDEGYQPAIPPSGEDPSSLIAEYWNGKEWAPFQDVIDETDGLTKSGFIVWEEVDKWAKSTPSRIDGLDGYQNNADLYWVRITLDDDFDSINIRAIKFLLSDDRNMQTIFPEINQYLPGGKSDFLEQHEAAKDSIVNLLKMDGIISYQEQLRNPDDWMLATSYTAVDIILTPISGDERLLEVKRDIAKKAAIFRNIAKGSIDRNKNEFLESDEDSDSNNPDSGSITGWMHR